MSVEKDPEEHIEDIIGVVNYANEQDMEVNIYLEDWSNGMKDSPEYVFQMVDALMHTNIKRYMLPDTLGVLNPLQVIEYMRKMVKRYPHAHFDFHPHNDYDLAVSNVLAAVLSGAKGLHTTINGLGERAGNAPLSSVQAILKDHFNAITNIDEGRLNEVSRVVESYSGIAIPANKPIVGENVFTQVAGCMPMETIRVTFIATTCYPSVSDVSGSMHWVRTVVRRTSVRIWKIWD